MSRMLGRGGAGNGDGVGGGVGVGTGVGGEIGTLAPLVQSGVPLFTCAFKELHTSHPLVKVLPLCQVQATHAASLAHAAQQSCQVEVPTTVCVLPPRPPHMPTAFTVLLQQSMTAPHVGEIVGCSETVIAIDDTSMV